MTTTTDAECSTSESTSVHAHHRFAGICTTREEYRQGRRGTAVKVFTISSESLYLLVQNVPGATDLSKELRSAFEAYGAVTEVRRLPDYPRERFMDVYLIRFENLPAARMAKRKLDDVDFYGGQLHVCYAPEFETVTETREKLAFRRRWVSSALMKLKTERATDGVSYSKKAEMGIKVSPMLSTDAPKRHLPVSQSSCHRFITTHLSPPAKQNDTRKRQVETSEHFAVPAPKRRACGQDQTVLDVRQVELKRQPLRMVPRSVSMKGKSSNVNTDRNMNNDTR